MSDPSKCWTVVCKEDERVLSQHGCEDKAEDSRWSLVNEGLYPNPDAQNFFITTRAAWNDEYFFLELDEYENSTLRKIKI